MYTEYMMNIPKGVAAATETNHVQEKNNGHTFGMEGKKEKRAHRT
jgi:hypothetical protein